MTTKIKQEPIISDEVKSKAKEIGATILHGMALAVGGLIVQSAASNYKLNKQRKLIADDPKVVDFSKKTVNA